MLTTGYATGRPKPCAFKPLKIRGRGRAFRPSQPPCLVHYSQAASSGTEFHGAGLCTGNPYRGASKGLRKTVQKAEETGRNSAQFRLTPTGFRAHDQVSSRVYGTIARQDEIGVLSGDPRRDRKRAQRGARDVTDVRQGELPVANRLNALIRRVGKRPNGEWRPEAVIGAPESRRRQRVGGNEFARLWPRNRAERRSLRSNGFVNRFRCGSEGAGREHGPRNGGESVVTGERKAAPSFQLRRDVTRQYAPFALTWHRLKGYAGEQRRGTRRHPAADRTPSMPVVRSIVP